MIIKPVIILSDDIDISRMVVDHLCKAYSNDKVVYEKKLAYTTRRRRNQNENDDAIYNFVSDSIFNSKVANGDFVEYSSVDYSYGTVRYGSTTDCYKAYVDSNGKAHISVIATETKTINVLINKFGRDNLSIINIETANALDYGENLLPLLLEEKALYKESYKSDLYINCTQMSVEGIAKRINNYVREGEPIMRTYLFEYDDRLDAYGEISFCASTLEEAFDLFDEYCNEELKLNEYYNEELNTSALEIITEIRRVYNSDDAEEYGENYE